MYLVYDYSRTWVEKYTFKKNNLVTGKFWCHIPGLLVKEQSPKKSSGMLFRILAEIKLFLFSSKLFCKLSGSKQRKCFKANMLFGTNDPNVQTLKPEFYIIFLE